MSRIIWHCRERSTGVHRAHYFRTMSVIKRTEPISLLLQKDVKCIFLESLPYSLPPFPMYFEKVN